MKTEVIVALVSLGGVILSTVISLLIAWRSTRYNYKQLFATTVSASRKKWIDIVTDSFAQYFAAAYAIRSIVEMTEADKSKFVKERIEYWRELVNAERMITQRFTLNDEYQKLIKYAFLEMRGIIETANDSRFSAKCEELEDLGRRLLKVEWNRVKRESGGKKC